MTTTTIDQMPTAPTGLPTMAACTCGKYDFVGLDNKQMREAIADHLAGSTVHGKSY